MGLSLVSTHARSSISIWLLACAVACGYVYQCPPFRLSYRGLGEPLCFAAFGPLATTAFYLLQGSSSGINHVPLTRTILSASVLVGLTTTLILFCSHFHQIEEDRDVGKMSPLVRLGTERGSMVTNMAAFTLYCLLLVFYIFNALPPLCLLSHPQTNALFDTHESLSFFPSFHILKSLKKPLFHCGFVQFICALTLPMGNLVVNYVKQNHEDKRKIFMAKYYCLRLHALFGAALTAGLVATRMIRDGSVPWPVFI